MLNRVLFILFYFFAWVLFFEFARIFFLLYEWPYTSHISAGLAFGSMWYGLKMDLSVAAYLTVPVCLLLMAGLVIPFFRKKTIYIIYTGLILFILLLLIIADVEIYKAWGNRIDLTPFKYFSAPKEMWASISHLPLFWILLGVMLVYFLLFWVFRKGITRISNLLQNQKLPWFQFIVLIFVTGAMIVPIRGGFQLSPLNQSSVYFSGNQFANNAAVNACWNFMRSVRMMGKLSHNPYGYMTDEEVKKNIEPLFKSSGNVDQVLQNPDSSRINVILIIWESFTEKALHVSIDGKPVIPYFPQLIKEGIYFSNCYSSGDRTDKGISAILSGYPAIPRGSIVNYPAKTSHLPGIPSLFSDKGYQTYFYYGGEPEFMNMKSYLVAQKIHHFISKENFSRSQMNSKWGAHDDVVIKRLLQDIPQMQQPFFTAWLTLSSHEPFETPVPTVIHGKDTKSKFLNSLHYTDSCIYEFITKLKGSAAWKNTLVIISADHGHPEPVTGNRADNYRIPVLWLGGALAKKDTVIAKTSCQLDIAPTLAGQFGFDKKLFPFGKDLLESTSNGWSFFIYNNGVGFVTDSSRFLFDNDGRRMMEAEGQVDKNQEKIAKALMQSIYTDFLKR